MEGKRPEIRFKGYDDEWVSKRFGDAFDFISNNTLSRDNLNNESGAALNVHYGDVLIKFGEYLDVQKEQLPFISDEALVSKFQASLLRDGDIIIADTAEDTTAGKCTEIVCVDGKKIISGLHTMACRPKEKYTLRFLGYCLNSPKYHNNLLPLMQGVKVLSISKSGISDTNIVISENRNEQGKIANFLAALDKEIKAELLKCEKLAILKKAMLKKMFPVGEQKVPEIRFDGYTDDWEQRKFGDIGTVSMCKRIFKNETSDKGEIPFYKIGTFGGEPDAYISRELFEEYKGKFSYPNKGDILLSASGTIGRIVEYDGEEAYFQDSNIVWLSHDESVCNKFLKVLYPVIRWDGIEGSTIQRLYNDNFLKTRFMMPSVEEQEKIGEYFSRLDNLITLHQCKLERLKNIKSACIKKMFV